MAIHIDGSVGTMVASSNNFYIAIVVGAAGGRMSPGLAHKSPIAQLIDACCKMRSVNSGHCGNSCKRATAERNLCGSCGLGRADSCSLNGARAS